MAGVMLLCGMAAPSAWAAGWAGVDPSSNYTIGELPSDCSSDPTDSACIAASVSYLDQARDSLGQPAYVLPTDFASLTPVQQVFILANSDRVLYGLPPIPGLTDTLNHDAGVGVQTDNDPGPSDANWMMYTANWAGGYQNIVLAYEGWMYDDGPGSGNLDCTATSTDGCWGHRHDILWQFDGAGAVAMGAAAGSDADSWPGYAMLLVQGNSSFHPTYTYTWAQAVADGVPDGGGSQSGGDGSGSGSTGDGAGSGSTGDGSGSGSTGDGSGSGSGSGSGGSNGGSGSSTGSSGTGSAGSASGSSSPSGASGSPSAHGARGRLTVKRVHVRGHRIALRIHAPAGTRVRCSLRTWRHNSWQVRRSKTCSGATTFRHVPTGHYHLRVTSAVGTLVRRLVVR
ncbi:MAG: hypothetical protein ACJ764_00585 [Solirubrobacteraceae bacterium]